MSSNKSQMFDEKIEGIERERESTCAKFGPDIVMISGDWKNIV